MRRRDLLVCALRGHRLEWSNITSIDLDVETHSCHCTRCGFIFGSVGFTATALAVRWYADEESESAVEQMKRKEEERVNRW